MNGQTPEGDNTKTIAILPLGAHEYHGPHLPLETDTLIVEGIAERLKAALPADIDAVFLDADPIGYSVEHADREGTRSLSWDKAIEGWIDIAENLASSGIRKLVLLNAHGGNSPLLTIVATEARIRFNMLCVATSWTRFGVPPGVISAEDKAMDIHGGDIETSVMLALHPDKVLLSELKDFPSRQSDFARDYIHLRAYGPHAFGWKMRDLNEDGAAGKASAATAEKGEKLIAHAVTGLVELIDDVAKFDMSILR
ncbi:creatininase family protein [Rhizobium sp. KVB221]|uniref:Creatininase family protein n=1 Tax=Rhizobium setariae TaxID=2801340 RepID=A0A936YRW3_9HYPH|nr:creatininase family protein [Rhizobium setariae]MBL0371686.1 creatininase family protein [Rhizobium setariae]